jgi:type VI protein secretion system component VasK
VKIVIHRRKKAPQPLNKILSQFLELRKFLKIKPWQVFSKKQLPWYLLLSSNDALSQQWLSLNVSHYTWCSYIAEYNDAVPHVNLYAAADILLIEPPAAFWQNPGKKALHAFNRWQSFCRLLSRQRRLQPLNGVLILLDFKLLQNPVALSAYAQQLKEILQHFSLVSLARLPLYFYVDGLADLPGFNAYMSKLRPEQKYQIFGITFHEAKYQGVALDQFESLFKSLLQNVDQKLLLQLPRDQSALINAEVAHFPLVLAEQQKPLKQLLQDSSYVGSMQHKLIVRGLYLMNLEFFGAAPLTQVILKEANIASVWQGLMQWCSLHKKRVILGSFLVLILCLSILGALTVHAYQHLADHAVAVQTVPINQNQDEITQVLNQMSETLAAVRSSDDAVVLSTQLLQHQVVVFNHLQALTQAAPLSMRPRLNQVLTNSVTTIFAKAQNSLVAGWHANVTASCNHLVNGAYPIVANSYADMSLDHFAKVFGVGGLVSHVLNAHVAALMRALQNHSSAYGVNFNLPAWLQNELFDSYLIQSAFFAHHDPALVMRWTPLYLSKNVAEFDLQMGQQKLMYQNGPRLMQTLSWPDNGTSVSIAFVNLHDHHYVQNYQGTWALMRLLQSGVVKRLGANNYQVTFANNGFSVSYQVSLAQGDFAGVLALSKFRCGG